LDRDFRAAWAKRNKGTTAKCSGFLAWRQAEYAGRRSEEEWRSIAVSEIP
jgi:hypothetical protein